eukprot:2479188-Prymnesium_polylepis.1
MCEQAELMHRQRFSAHVACQATPQAAGGANGDRVYLKVVRLRGFARREVRANGSSPKDIPSDN